MCKYRTINVRAIIVVGSLTLSSLSGTGSSNNYAYLVVDDKSRDAVIIDPAHPEEYIPRARVIRSMGS